MYIGAVSLAEDGIVSICSMKEKAIVVFGIFWLLDILEGAIHVCRVSQIQHHIACSKTTDGRPLVGDIVENGDWMRYGQIVAKEGQGDQSC